MPNHLTPSPVVPELIQENATATNLIVALERLLDDSAYYEETRSALATIAPLLSGDSSARAAQAIVELMQSEPQKDS